MLHLENSYLTFRIWLHNYVANVYSGREARGKFQFTETQLVQNSEVLL